MDGWGLAIIFTEGRTASRVVNVLGNICEKGDWAMNSFHLGVQSFCCENFFPLVYFQTLCVLSSEDSEAVVVRKPEKRVKFSFYGED